METRASGNNHEESDDSHEEERLEGRKAAMITVKDKLQCAERELKFRQRVYPRMVENGRMSMRQVKRELEVMEAIVTDYRDQAAAVVTNPDPA